MKKTNLQLLIRSLKGAVAALEAEYTEQDNSTTVTSFVSRNVLIFRGKSEVENKNQKSD